MKFKLNFKKLEDESGKDLEQRAFQLEMDYGIFKMPRSGESFLYCTYFPIRGIAFGSYKVTELTPEVVEEWTKEILNAEIRCKGIRIDSYNDKGPLEGKTNRALLEVKGIYFIK